jgi:hypothetical protein
MELNGNKIRLPITIRLSLLAFKRGYDEKEKLDSDN